MLLLLYYRLSGMYRIQILVFKVDSNGMVEKGFENLFHKEKKLRKEAFKNVEMNMDESFFTDDDLKSEYFITTVFDSKTKEVLLVSRHYFNKKMIVKNLSFNRTSECEWLDLDINNFKEGELFLADRLAGNETHPIYQKHRQYIFNVYYSKFITLYSNCKLVLFARSQLKENLLSKYIRIGFNLIGCIEHNERKHWIVINDLSKSYKFIDKTLRSFLILKILQLIKK